MARQVGWAGGMSNQLLEGGQQGIKLVQVVETAGSGGLSWHRWWRRRAVGDQVGEGGEFEVVDGG